MPILPRSADRRRRELASLLDHLQRMREAGPLSEVPKLCVEGLNRVDREFPDLRPRAYPPLLTTLAFAQWSLEEFGAASDTYARLATFGEEHGGAPEDVEFAWEGASRSAGEAEQHEAAEGYARRAIALASEVGDAHLIARTTVLLGETLAAQDRKAEATDTYHSALEFPLGDSDDAAFTRCQSYLGLARMALKRGDGASARLWSEQLKETLGHVKHPNARFSEIVDELLEDVSRA